MENDIRLRNKRKKHFKYKHRIKTKRNLGDKIWFAELEKIPLRIGCGIIKRIYVNATMELSRLGDELPPTYSEYYDIEGLYENGIRSGVMHDHIPELYCTETREELSNILN